MSTELRSQHDLGEIVGLGWRTYIDHFRSLFLIALIVAPMQMLVIIVTRQIDDAVIAQNVALLLQIPTALVGLVASTAVIHAVNEAAHARPIEPGTSLDAGLQNFWPAFTALLLVFVRVLLSLLAVPFLAVYWLLNRDAAIDGRRDWYFAVVPFALFFYLALRWAFVTNAVVIEGKRGWAALDDSADAVRGNWWRSFGIVLVISLIQAGPLLLSSLAAAAPPVIEGIVAGLAGAFILPFTVAAQTLLYYDLKARRQANVSPVRIDDP